MPTPRTDHPVPLWCCKGLHYSWKCVVLTQNHGLSPLTIVSLHGFVEVVVVLLEHGAAVNPAPVCGC